LYDLQQDLYEFHNLADCEELRAVRDRFFQELHQWRVETRDPLLDLAALRDLVLREKNAPPTPLPAGKKASAPKTSIKSP